MNSFEIIYTLSNGDQASEEVRIHETKLDFSNRGIMKIDLKQFSQFNSLQYLNLSDIRVSSDTSLNPLVNLKELETLYLSIEPDSSFDITSLFFLRKLTRLVINQKKDLKAHWMLKYFSPKPSWFDEYSDYVWDEHSNLEDYVPLILLHDFLESLLKQIEEDRIETDASIKLCCELIRILTNNLGLKELYKESKLNTRVESTRQQKRKKIVTAFQENDRSLSKLLCIAMNFTIKKLHRIKRLRKYTSLESIRDCGEPTKKQRMLVSSFLKKRQNPEEIRRMNVWFSSILAIFLVINISLVLYFRIIYQSLLNTLLANLAIPSAIVSLILPLLHSYSNHQDRIDFRVMIGKIAYLYITNILAVGISFLIYTFIENSLIVLRLSFNPTLIDILSLFFLLVFVIGWAHAAYAYVEAKDINWLESVFKPSRKMKRSLPGEEKCELSEIETFILVGGTYTELAALFWIFTIINLTFVWTTIEGMYLFEFSEPIGLFLPIWPIFVYISVGILIWKIIWTIINGRIIQSKLVEDYLNREESS